MKERPRDMDARTGATAAPARAFRAKSIGPLLVRFGLAGVWPGKPGWLE